MKFTKMELNIIYYVLIVKKYELEKDLESTDERYANETGDFGITDKDADEFLHEEIGKLIEKIRGSI